MVIITGGSKEKRWATARQLALRELKCKRLPRGFTEEWDHDKEIVSGSLRPVLRVPNLARGKCLVSQI